MPVAVFGIVQLPFVPRTANVTTSPAPSADARAPTWSAPDLVSASRHGTIGTYDDAPLPSALALSTMPIAATVAAASAAATPTWTNLNCLDPELCDPNAFDIVSSCPVATVGDHDTVDDRPVATVGHRVGSASVAEMRKCGFG